MQQTAPLSLVLIKIYFFLVHPISTTRKIKMMMMMMIIYDDNDDDKNDDDDGDDSVIHRPTPAVNYMTTDLYDPKNVKS